MLTPYSFGWISCPVVGSTSVLLGEASLPSVGFVGLFDMTLCISLMHGFPSYLELTVFAYVGRSDIFLPRGSGLLLLALISSAVVLIFGLVLFFYGGLGPEWAVVPDNPLWNVR